MPTDEHFVAAAAAAAPAWGLEPLAIEVMSRSENVVCDLTLPDDRHLVMRLHRPGYNSPDELASEVRWVSALQASGLPVSSPLATLDGDYYVSARVDAEYRQVGVVEWVDGRALGGPTDPGQNEVTSHYVRIGELAAAIRAHHRVWQPPSWFVRRRWDGDGLVGPDPLWGRFWEVPGLSETQRSLFATARRQLHAALRALPTDDEHFGLIHADLHLGNVMAAGDHLTVIDFDDSGYGWFAHELAVALHSVLGQPTFDDARAALFEGYRRGCRLSDAEAQWIDMFLTIRCLMIVGWLAARSDLPAYRHFGDLVVEAEQMATRYLDRGVG